MQRHLLLLSQGGLAKLLRRLGQVFYGRARLSLLIFCHLHVIFAPSVHEIGPAVLGVFFGCNNVTAVTEILAGTE